MATANFNTLKGEGIKLAQRGTFYTGSNGTGQFNIPLPIAVETTKTAVKLNGIHERMNDNSILSMGRIALNGTSNLLLDRATSSISQQAGLAGCYVSWEVIEYNNVGVLRGTAVGQFNMNNTISTTIPTVDPARSQINVLGVTVDSYDLNPGNTVILPTLTANSIGFNTAGGSTVQRINWEIVTFNY